MTDFHQLSSDYASIEKAILYLEAHSQQQPDLAVVAAHVGLSEYHFQRLFSRWAGISPKRFLQFLTKEHAKELLLMNSVMSAAFGSGLSSPGRLHDLFVHTEAVTPGEYKTQGLGVEIIYGFHPTPFGECLLAMTPRGICFLGFVTTDRENAMGELRKNWWNATLVELPDQTRGLAETIFSPNLPSGLSLHIRGTNFQLKIWEALLQLEPGEMTTYGSLAARIGKPSASQAVGNAVGRNPVAYLIPCHHVLRQVGGFGDYRYGSARKKAILIYESAQAGGLD